MEIASGQCACNTGSAATKCIGSHCVAFTDFGSGWETAGDSACSDCKCVVPGSSEDIAVTTKSPPPTPDASNGSNDAKTTLDSDTGKSVTTTPGGGVTTAASSDKTAKSNTLIFIIIGVVGGIVLCIIVAIIAYKCCGKAEDNDFDGGKPLYQPTYQNNAFEMAPSNKPGQHLNLAPSNRPKIHRPISMNNTAYVFILFSFSNGLT